jgi:hypothetical protein
MKAHPAPLEPQELKELPPQPPLSTDEEELTDEEAFYLAQEESFADLRARYENRLRRKM